MKSKIHIFEKIVRWLLVFTWSYSIDLVLIHIFRNFFIIMDVTLEIFIKAHVLLYIYDETFIIHK